MRYHASEGLPKSCPFAPNHAGVEDVAIFDFSKKQQSITPFKIVGQEVCHSLLSLLALLVIESLCTHLFRVTTEGGQ